MKSTETIGYIKKNFPDVDVQLLQGGFGMNLRFIDKTVLTVYFHKEVYCNNKKGVWRNLNGHKELYEVIKETVNPIKNTPKITLIENDKGTSACIEHLEKRYQSALKNNASTNVLNIIKQLKQELEQFL